MARLDNFYGHILFWLLVYIGHTKRKHTGKAERRGVLSKLPFPLSPTPLG